MGSGRAIKAAIKKHGKRNFIKQVLFIFNNKNDAYSKEAELTKDFNLSENYNMRRGGVGGFTKENSLKGNIASRKSPLNRNGGLAVRDRKVGIFSATKDELRARGRSGGLSNKGKTKTESHKIKIRESMRKYHALKIAA